MIKKFLVFIVLLSLLMTSCAVSTSHDSVTASPTPAPAITASPAPAYQPTPVPTVEPTQRPLLDVNLVSSCIDESFFDIPSEKGTLETVSYETNDYYGTKQSVTKNMCVYLPYGYDENTQYDVLFLMHTIYGSERFWFSEHEYRMTDDSSKNLYIPYLIDNMIEKGLCRPLIVVSLCGYLDDYDRNQSDANKIFSQLSYEFRHDVLPFVCENYSVYGTREHVGFMGASFGAYVTYRCMLGPNYDLIGSYALTGGGMIEFSWLISKWDDFGYEDVRPDMIYIAEGDCDDRGPVELGYMNLAANTSWFDENNLKFTLYENTKHEFREWDNTLYNCLQLFFRQEGD